MKPLAWKPCALRVFMALATMATLLVAAGCGSSPIIRPLPGGFTNASLNGQYVITLTGIGVNQQLTASDPFSETIVFTADGNRNLNITVDDFDQVGGPFILPAPLTGTYSISPDGTGSLFFNNSNYAITMIDDSHFYVIQQDNFATASGFGEKQDTTAFSAAPSGTFVFRAHDVNSNSSRVGRVAITNSAISGTEDLLTLGILSSSKSIASTVSMTTPNTDGLGTFTLDDGTSFNYYIVNAGKFHFMSNSTSGSLEIGQAEGQTGGPFSVGTLAAGTSYVFGSAGDTSFQAGIHSAGVFTTDGNGNITAGAVDFVQDATVNSNLVVSGGTYTLDTDGHGQITLNSSGGVISPQIFWTVNGTRAVFLVDSTAAVEDGTFSLQQGAPFSSLANQAAFVMDGFDVTFKDRVGVFAPTNSGFKWNQAANAFDDTIGFGTLTTTATNGAAQVNSNGRVAVTVNGVTNNLVFYLSSPGTGFMVQEDADIGGSFTQQASQ